MSFKFNFSSSDNGDNGEEGNDDNTAPVEPAVEIKISNDAKIPEQVELQELSVEDGSCLRYVTSQPVEERLRRDTSRLTPALEGNSDLVPNVYEGGLKVWECSIDLVHYLSSLDIAFRGLKVLELGCGAGLPGLYTYVKGATVHFQDYNKEVIDNITIPNYLHNSPDEKDGTLSTVSDACRFFAGDWTLVQDLLLSEIGAVSEKYDVILTSETIYCADNYRKLHDTMKNLLKPEGVAYLAAKTYYFGVGGGLREFESKVTNWGVFEIKSCRQFTEGVQREIMELRFKSCAKV